MLSHLDNSCSPFCLPNHRSGTERTGILLRFPKACLRANSLREWISESKNFASEMPFRSLRKIPPLPLRIFFKSRNILTLIKHPLSGKSRISYKLRRIEAICLTEIWLEHPKVRHTLSMTRDSRRASGTRNEILDFHALENDNLLH